MKDVWKNYGLPDDPDNNKCMLVYSVVACRDGDDNKHSYLVGVYDDPWKATRFAIAEEYWRGCKYKCDIIESYLGEQIYPESGTADELLDYVTEKCLPNGEFKEEITKRMIEEGLL